VFQMPTKGRESGRCSAKMWLLQLSSLERVYTVQPNVDRNEVNLSDSLMKNISDTKKCIQDLSQKVAEIGEVLERSRPQEDYGKMVWQR